MFVESYITDALRPLHEKSKTSKHTILKGIRINQKSNSALTALSVENFEKLACFATTVRLLNQISRAYYIHKYGYHGTQPAVIFTSRPHRYPPGDYLGLHVRPDYHAYIGTFEELKTACESDGRSGAKPVSVFIAVGGHKRPEDVESAVSQLKTYASAVKRYRVDLPAVHAFTIEKGRLQLASINACEISRSPAVSIKTLDPWIAHVTLVYSSYTQRDRTIQYCTSQAGFHRWDVTYCDMALVVSPFYVSQLPGRATFACFEVAKPSGDVSSDQHRAIEAEFESGVAQGFWKLSWQRVTARETESAMLTHLHKNGWVPGLVRHHEQSSFRATNVLHHPAGVGAGRVKEVFHLGSVGQPLSQCETAGELLDVMYDLIETHAHMCELDILHRDVSWYNVLCKPRHLLKLQPALNECKVLDRPCIKRLFGDPNGESSVLLTDLDHAVMLENGNPPVALANGQMVGTPMFISCEISNNGPGFNFPEQSFIQLQECLEDAETNLTIFHEAFPKGDGDFMAKFERVVAAELKRSQSAANEGLFKTTSSNTGPRPAPRHDRRHDAESIYWVFLWAFARARPANANRDESKAASFHWHAYNSFCKDMFEHSIDGNTGEYNRSQWMLFKSKISKLFHLDLKPFEALFAQMASYLAIPWYLYCGPDAPTPIMPADHVHMAFRRLILAFRFHTDYDAVRHIVLDTETPRFTTALDVKVRNQGISTVKHGFTGLSHTWGPSDEVANLTQVKPAPAAGASRKRKAAASAAPAAAKKVKSSARRVREVDDAHKDDGPADSFTATDAVDGPEPGVDADEDVEVYDALKHKLSFSAKALRLMFWKDRMLWFGSGAWSPLAGKAAATPAP